LVDGLVRALPVRHPLPHVSDHIVRTEA
jgi:hypothetical protein